MSKDAVEQLWPLMGRLGIPWAPFAQKFDLPGFESPFWHQTALLYYFLRSTPQIAFGNKIRKNRQKPI